MVDHEIQEQCKEHRFTIVGQTRKSISDSAYNRKSANLRGQMKLRAQDPSQYTAKNYSLLTKLGGGSVAMHIAVINHSFTDSLTYYPLLTLMHH